MRGKVWKQWITLAAAGMVISQMAVVPVRAAEQQEGGEAAAAEYAQESEPYVEGIASVSGGNREEPGAADGAGDQFLTADTAAGNIASGQDGNITWVIDAGGKLTVEGTGDLSRGDQPYDLAWTPYNKQITSAKISVKGMTDASWLFFGCENMRSVDVSDFETSNVTNMAHIFRVCESLKSVDMSSFETGNVKDMSNMFSDCRSLASVDVSGFDTSNVMSMYGMFDGCESLTSVDVSGFVTYSVRSMSNMFNGCTNLTSVDVSGFNATSVYDMQGMFADCTSLKSVDMSRIEDTGRVRYMDGLFYGCESLTSIDMSGLDIDNASVSNMFLGCDGLNTIKAPYSMGGKQTIDLPASFLAFLEVNGLGVKGFETQVLSATFCDSTLTRIEAPATDLIARGWIEDIVWVIDADGKLTVEGTGDLPGDHGVEEYEWRPYSQYITSAEIRVSGLKDASYLFRFCSNLKSIDMSGFDTKSVTDMSYMFDGCSSLVNVDVSGFDTRNVTNMRAMFYCCRGLKSVDVSGFDTSKVTDMSYMFGDCWDLTSVDVSGFKTGNVTDMSYMFEDCEKLVDLGVSGFDTRNVMYMGHMFYRCKSLKSVDVNSFETGNVKDMSGMFSYCGSLESVDVNSFETGNVKDMSNMFSDCSSLESVDVSGFDTGNVTNMGWMFAYCSGLTSVDVSGFETGNVTDMSGMFNGCESLTSVDISSFDTGSVTDMSDMFSNCPKLNSIKTPHKMGTAATALPAAFTDAKGTETRILSKDFCNTTLTRKLPKPSPAKFTVAGVIGGRNVTFNTDTKDAVIYYSAKTSNLTTADACVKPGETVLFENFYGTIYAKAYANGQWSNVSRLVLKIPVVSKPTITSKDGVVTIKTTTPDSYIYYTTDGSVPSPANGKKLVKSGGSFTVPANCTVKAIAVRSCFTNSEVASAKVAARKLGAPSFVVKGVIGGREVTFNTTETKGEIYYSFTTSNITTKDRHVKPGEKVLFQNYYGTVYARTYVNGQWSNVSRLVLKIPVVNKPTITAAGAGKVKISTTTPSCAIYYTTDGSTPSPTNGTRINSSSSVVTVGRGKTVKAIAVRSCFTNSDVATYRQK